MDVVVTQVAHEIVPDAALSDNGAVAATAIVPFWFGAVSVVVVPVVTLEASKAIFLVLSPLFWISVELSVKVLFVKVAVWLAKIKVSLAESAGMVAILETAGAALLIVVVLVVPKTSWLVVFVRFSAAKVGVAPVLIFCGRDKVTAPVVPETLT